MRARFSSGMPKTLEHTQSVRTLSDIRGELLSKISDRSARVAVIGVGYVGLPFAVEKAKVGYRVLGIDRNAKRVDSINRGESYILDVQSSELSFFVSSGRIQATTNFSELSETDVIVIAVPTPLTHHFAPDLQYVENVTQQIIRHLRKGHLIVLESTTYPGTTEEVILPLLERTGMKGDSDFFLAHSPERVDPGNRRYSTRNTNKVVGAIGPHSQQIAVHFYSQTIERVISVSNTKTAELVKVFENTFRAVNIALVNELALLCDKMGLNVWEVLEAAFTKPFGIMPFYPGPGVGGHCIPIDPHYLEWKAKAYDFATHFISLAGEINRKMPYHVRDKIHRLLNHLGLPPSKSRILILGAAYKRDIPDFRESPAIEILRLLKADGANVCYHDPLIPLLETPDFKMESVELGDSILHTQDLVVIVTDHSTIDYDYVVSQSKAILDTRNATRTINRHRDRITLL